MRFGTQITKQICEELKKMPNIRYVCNKVGIDHSTFYRWVTQHHTFSQLVTASLLMGRDRISDAAEGVIISGIQNGDPKSSIYWLSHNNPRYSSREQAKYLYEVNEGAMEILQEPVPKSSAGAFEACFRAYYVIETLDGAEAGRKYIDPLVKLMCHEDAKLEEIFYAAYEEWKMNENAIKEKTKEANEPYLDQNP